MLTVCSTQRGCVVVYSIDVILNPGRHRIMCRKNQDDCAEKGSFTVADAISKTAWGKVR